jgi:hypothetical protein
MQVKVKIGCAYEPKWFERRYSQGTYSGKNIPLDEDGMWLQNAMIGKPRRRDLFPFKVIVLSVASLIVIYTYTYF